MRAHVVDDTPPATAEAIVALRLAAAKVEAAGLAGLQFTRPDGKRVSLKIERPRSR